ncbi:MAG: hypothetical protein ABSH51_01675 [Solirubrobacteraceae bacterium]|jgi:hypothetical protein
MADWVTISSLATAGGTLVLAVATFSSVRSANRSARVAQQSLLVGMRPVLIPSRQDDPVERVAFGDGRLLIVPGNGGAVERSGGVVYLAIGLRNGGSGLAVIHSWRARPRGQPADGSQPAPDTGDFRRQQIDLYIPAGDTGRWLGALRDPGEPGYAEVNAAIRAGEPVVVDLLYGDHEGGQRTIARFSLTPWPTTDDGPSNDVGLRAIVLRYWNLDRDDPR